MCTPDNVYASGSDMLKVLQELRVYYTKYYNELLNDTDNAEAHAQVSSTVMLHCQCHPPIYEFQYCMSKAVKSLKLYQ